MKVEVLINLTEIVKNLQFFLNCKFYKFIFVSKNEYMFKMCKKNVINREN